MASAESDHRTQNENVWTPCWARAIRYGLNEWQMMPIRCESVGSYIELTFRKLSGTITRSLNAMLSAMPFEDICLIVRMSSAEIAIVHYGGEIGIAPRPHNDHAAEHIDALRSLLFILLVQGNTGLQLLQSICISQFDNGTADWARTASLTVKLDFSLLTSYARASIAPRIAQPTPHMDAFIDRISANRGAPGE